MWLQQAQEQAHIHYAVCVFVCSAQIKHMHRKTVGIESWLFFSPGTSCEYVSAGDIASISFLCPMNRNEKLQSLNGQIQSEHFGTDPSGKHWALFDQTNTELENLTLNKYFDLQLNLSGFISALCLYIQCLTPLKTFYVF